MWLLFLPAELSLAVLTAVYLWQSVRGTEEWD